MVEVYNFLSNINILLDSSSIQKSQVESNVMLVYLAQRESQSPSGILDLARPFPMEFRLLTCHLREIRSNTPSQGKRKPHSHAVYHILFFLEGRDWIWFHDSLREVSPGLLLFSSPGVPHDFAPQSREGRLIYDEVTFAYRRVDNQSPCLLPFESIFQSLLGVPNLLLPQFHYIPATDWSRIHRFYEEIVVSASQLGGEHLNTLMVILNFFRKIVSYFSDSQNISSPNSPLLERVLYYMQTHLGEQISLRKLSQIACCSKVHLCRIFRQKLGISPYDYLRQIRIQSARNLLQYTGLSCSEIAQEIGYTDVFSFSKAFKKITGTSPVDWRKRSRKGKNPS